MSKTKHLSDSELEAAIRHGDFGEYYKGALVFALDTGEYGVKAERSDALPVFREAIENGRSINIAYTDNESAFGENGKAPSRLIVSCL